MEKGKPAGGYYNTRERDNNDDNDKRERESRSGRRLEPIDEREEYTRSVSVVDHFRVRGFLLRRLFYAFHVCWVL